MTQPLHPVVFITGASSGIGAAAVPVFAGAGYDVVLAARREERLEQIAREAEKKHPDARCLPVVCDVTNDESVAAAFAVVAERYGRLDVLVNNAGFGVYGSVEDTPLEKFRANMETNFFGALRCTKAALPLLRNAATNPLTLPSPARGEGNSGGGTAGQASSGTALAVTSPARGEGKSGPLTLPLPQGERERAAGARTLSWSVRSSASAAFRCLVPTVPASSRSKHWLNACARSCMTNGSRFRSSIPA